MRILHYFFLSLFSVCCALYSLQILIPLYFDNFSPIAYLLRGFFVVLLTCTPSALMQLLSYLSLIL